jgi:hypothetical protein
MLEVFWLTRLARLMEHFRPYTRGRPMDGLDSMLITPCALQAFDYTFYAYMPYHTLFGIFSYTDHGIGSKQCDKDRPGSRGCISIQ